MSLIPEFASAPREEDEGLFSRDLNGQLIRSDAVTDEAYRRTVKLSVNGESVELPMAEPLNDVQGNTVMDIDGRTTPRYTTILDAVLKLNATPQAEGKQQVRVATLCHQPHMKPVAVCRMCMVQVCSRAGDKLIPERKLSPACQLRGRDGMEIFTMNAPGEYGDRVRHAVGLIAGLLMSDHLKPLTSEHDKELAEFNELGQLTFPSGPDRSRFAQPVFATGAHRTPVVEPPGGRRAKDLSSPVIEVDHSACILCDRCIRACDEVVRNNVIGRTGKGLSAGIGFDLNYEMFASSCVQCGECMVSCPTTAITFKPLKKIRSTDGPDLEPVSLEELRKDPLFSGVPPKFLLWQTALVLRRPVTAGGVLCRQGEPGNRAFIIKRGRLQGLQHDDKGNVLREFECTKDDVIVGEMACLSGGPRNADIVALEDGEVWEVRRNVLDRMMRSPAQQGMFRMLYNERALDTAMTTLRLFAGLPQSESDFLKQTLRPRLEFIRVTPGAIIFKQGDLANDRLYLIRLGHVRAEISRDGQKISVFYRGPNTVIGEIGLLALSSKDAGKSPEQVDREVCDALDHAPAGDLSAALPAGQRTTTCSALDHVELVRIGRSDLLETVRRCPVLRMRLIKVALDRLREDV
jgi:CRP-like cAMP-binding protein/NAD-dependent dihydropyrimidine dehydrogenase PreA subunit